MGDLHDLRFGEVQYLLNALGFLVLQIQDDFRAAVVDDALAVLAVVQGEEVVQILCRANAAAGIGADGLEDLQHHFSRQTVTDAEGAGAAADELPAFVDEDGLFLRAVGFGFIPHEIQSYEHPDRQ